MQQELKHYNLEQENRNLDHKPKFLELIPENTDLEATACLNIKTIEILTGSTIFKQEQLQEKVKDFALNAQH